MCTLNTELSDCRIQVQIKTYLEQILLCWNLDKNRYFHLENNENLSLLDEIDRVVGMI